MKKLLWTNENTNQFWDAVARSPLDDLAFAKTAGPQLIKILQPYLGKNSTILDYGAGSGHFAELLLKEGHKVAALEPSPERRKLLEARLGGYPGFKGVIGPDDNSQYDVVIMMEVIEHVLENEFADFLVSVSNKVAKGGRLIVTTPNAENLDYAQVYSPTADEFFHPWQHQRSFTASKLAELFAPHGLKRNYVILADFSNDAAIYDLWRSWSSVAHVSGPDLVKMVLGQQIQVQQQLLQLLKDFNDCPEQRQALATGVVAHLQQQQRNLEFLLTPDTISQELAYNTALGSSSTWAALQEALAFIATQAGSVKPEADSAAEAAPPAPAVAPANDHDLQIGRGGNLIFIAEKSGRKLFGLHKLFG